MNLPNIAAPQNNDVVRFTQSLMGVMGWFQSHLEILTTLDFTQSSEPDAKKSHELGADLAKQSVECMAAVLREWSDWLADPSLPMPTIPTAALSAASAAAFHQSPNASQN